MRVKIFRNRAEALEKEINEFLEKITTHPEIHYSTFVIGHDAFYSALILY